MTKEGVLKELLDQISRLAVLLESNFNSTDLKLIEDLARNIKELTSERDASTLLAKVLSLRDSPRKRRTLLSDIRALAMELYPDGLSRRGLLGKLAIVGAVAALKPSMLFASENEDANLEDAFGREYSLAEIYKSNENVLFVIAPSISAAKKMKAFFEQNSSTIQNLNGLKIYKLLALPKTIYMFAIRTIRNETPQTEVPYLLIDWGDKCISDIFKPSDPDEILIAVVNKKGEIAYSKSSPITEQDFANIQKTVSKA